MHNSHQRSFIIPIYPRIVGANQSLDEKNNMSSIIDKDDVMTVVAVADQQSKDSGEKVNDIDVTMQSAPPPTDCNEKQSSTSTSCNEKQNDTSITSLPPKSVDDNMELDEPEGRKSRRVPKTPSSKQQQPPPSVVQESKVVETPQDLYEQIKNSRDKLFFISYPNDKYKSKKKSTSNNKEREFQWCLVRVDLTTCKTCSDETKQCQSTGKYYVEFYMKASYDQGILLTGNKLENGISSAKMMKPKADNQSRYWLEFHEYHINKAGEMEVGKWKEFQPNTPKAIIQRLMDLVQQKRQDKFNNSQDAVSGSDNTNVESDGEERLIQEYHPNFDKYTTWADVLDLFDTTTRLVGPFDFDDTIPPPMEEKDLKMLSEECKKVFSANQSRLYVKDRVPLKKWEELSEVVKDKDIDPPTIVVESKKKKPKKKKQSTGTKRPREESKEGQVKQSSKKSSKKARKETNKEKELLNFPAISSQSSLSIRASDKGKKIVSKDKASQEVSSIVQEAFAKTRQATSNDGKTYYILSELKDTLSKAIESWTGDKEVSFESPSVSKASKKLPEAQAKVSSEPLEGLHESDFSTNVVESLPVAYAYEVDDPAGISEENAKIAQLDYAVEERRFRRSNIQSAKNKEDKIKEKKITTGSAKKSKSPRVRKTTVTEIPAGWSLKAVKRSGDTNHIDRYWEHPDLPQGLCVRSKVGVQTLIDFAEANNCGISKAYEKYKDVSKFWTKTR